MMAVWNLLIPILPIYSGYSPFFASAADIGIIITASAISGIILRIPFGSLSDKNRRIVLLISLIASSIGSALYFFSDSIIMLIISGLIMGVSGSSFVPVVLSILSDLHKEKVERQRRFAIFSIMSSLGVISGPVILNYLLSLISMKEVFLLTASISSFCIILVFVGIRNLPKPKSSTDFKSSFSHILKNKNFISATILLSCTILALGVVESYLPLFIENFLLMDPEININFIIVRSLMIVIMRVLIFLNVQNKIGIKRFSTLALFLNLALPLITFRGQYLDVLFAVSLSGLAHGAIYPISSYLVSRSVKSNELGLANALLFSFVDIFRSISLILFGIFAEIFTVSYLFLFAGLISGVGAIISATLMRIEA